MWEDSDVEMNEAKIRGQETSKGAVAVAWGGGWGLNQERGGRESRWAGKYINKTWWQ